MSAQITPADFVDKQELIRRIQTARDNFLRRLDDVPENLLQSPNAVDAWSIQDLLAHFIAHEQRALAELNAALRGEKYDIDHGENDAFNARAVAELHPQPFAAVLQAWLDSTNQIVTTLESMRDTDFEPSSPVCRLLDDTIDGALANNTYEHYAEHLPGVEAWLRARI